MSYDNKELEIKLQFLDEAQDYVNALDAAVLGLSSAGIDLQRINTALRAAHSIKGGAAMMGYAVLSELAHQLEDSFKVLKIQREAIAIDATLETNLLNAIDCLNQVIAREKQRSPVDEAWVQTAALPVFERLHEQLGEPQEEDASSVLATEDSQSAQDILRILFETEVDGCLERLESVLANQDPCLKEEVEILAQELGGLGEMLQLTAFTQLCQSVTDHLLTAPDRATEIATAALSSWRRSQALVLTANLAELPTAIAVTGMTVTPTVFPSVFPSESADITSSEAVVPDFDWDNLEDASPEVVVNPEMNWDSLSFGRVPDAADGITNIPMSTPIDASSDSNLEPAFDSTFSSTFDSTFDLTSGSTSSSTSSSTSGSTFDSTGSTFDSVLAPAVSTNFNTTPDPFNIAPNTTSRPHPDIPIDTADSQNINATGDTTWYGSAIDFLQSFEPTVESSAESLTEPLAESLTEPLTESATELRTDPSIAWVSRTAGQDFSAQSFSVVPAPPPTLATPAVNVPGYRTAVTDTQTVNPTPIETPDVTVRVSSKQLDQLNDLAGELTIERNAIDLHLKRLRSLVQSLGQRVQTLDESNSQLRDNYDRVETRSRSPLLLPGSLLLESGNSADTSSLALTHHGFDALEMDRYDSNHQLSQEVMETIVQIQEVTNDIELVLDDSEQTARNLNKTARQLQTKLTRVRMRPLSDITDRFPRALRELSLQHDKPVRLEVYGGNVLVDRNVLEALNEPLMHLMRNAFDHGIEDRQTRVLSNKPEEGVLSIRAMNQNNRTIITVQDDGAGIDLEKIRQKAQQMGLDEVLLASASEEDLLSLIFEPGFSTSDQVTALSGRGVGMDIVRDRLKQVQGDIKVNTISGVGTTFTISVPFTLSVTRVLLVESNRMLMALPMDLIEEIFILQPDQIMVMAGSEIFSWQGTMVQLVRLARSLQFNCPRQVESLESAAAVNVPSVLLLNPAGQRVGIEIDRSWGEQEVTIRKVEGGLPMPPGFSHCTILGDGRVVPIVNVPELLRWLASRDRYTTHFATSSTPFPAANSVTPNPVTANGVANGTTNGTTNGTANGQTNRQGNGAAIADQKDQQPTILIIDDSVNVRRLLALTLEKAGYQVAQAKDGQDALDKLAAGLAIQAVICDIEMPRLDGYSFLARFRANPVFDRIPITMLTTRSGDKHRQLAMNLGATAYVSKPYNEQALLQTLEELMATA